MTEAMVARTPYWILVPCGLCVVTALALRGAARAPASVPAGTPSFVALRKGDGKAGAPVADPTQQPPIVRLHFPAGFAGRRIDLAVRRAEDGARAWQDWLRLRPRVRADGLLPIGGLPRGRYALDAMPRGAAGGRALRGIAVIGDALAVDVSMEDEPAAVAR